MDHLRRLRYSRVVARVQGPIPGRGPGSVPQHRRFTAPSFRVRKGAQFACRKILVALDSTPVHEPALPVAAHIARAWGAALHLVTVVPTTTTLSAERAGAGMLLPTTMTAVLDLAQRGAVEYLQKITATLKRDGLTASADVVRGDTAPAILESVARVEADMIVLATHGRGNFDAFWSGSVTPKVLSRADVPVLLVRVTGEEVER